MFGLLFKFCVALSICDARGSAVNKRTFADQMTLKQREKKKSNVDIILEWKKTTNVVSVPRE